MAYFAGVVFVLVYHVFKQPRIRNSSKELNRVKYKFWFIWGPLVVLALAAEILIIIVSVSLKDQMKIWLEATKNIRFSYLCTYSSIRVDHEIFERDSDKQVELCIFIIMLQSMLIIFTLIQYITHYRMFIRFLRENPIDGWKIARSIQVGIPPE